MILLRNPTDLFVELVDQLKIRETTKAYVVGVFNELIKFRPMEENSIVLAYARACSMQNFEKYQELGDWILWSSSFVPELHKGCEILVMDLGRRSYETCWRLLRGQWDVYAELADQFPTIVTGVNTKVRFR